MLDRSLLAILKPLTINIARKLHGLGIGADQLTFTAFGIGVLSALLISLGFSIAALPLLLASRALDGLDGALARLSAPTDRGAFLDIALDFLFYSLIPLGFAIASPQANALAACALLAAFIGTGTSFLAFSVIAEKRGLKSAAYPAKGIYYLGGLTEGTETIACFTAMCLWPNWFAFLGYCFAVLCVLTTIMRLIAGWQAFKN